MNQANVDPAQLQHIMAAMVPLFGLFFLLFLAILIVPFWFAFKKAGLSPFLSLLVLIPGIGLLVTLYVLAFARWRVIPAAPEYPAYPTSGYPPMQYAQAEYSHPAAPLHAPTAAYPPPPPASPYPPVPPTDGR